MRERRRGEWKEGRKRIQASWEEGVGIERENIVTGGWLEGRVGSKKRGRE